MRLSYPRTGSMKLRLFVSGAILVFALAASGCGGGGSKHKAAASKKTPGAKVFASAGCSGCHTLKAANAKGQVGPNLDELKPDESTVEHQVRTGGNGMPSFSNKLSAKEIAQGAAFVSSSSRAAGTTVEFKPDDTTVGDCEKSEKPFCYRQAFGNLTYREGPEKA